MRPLRHFEDFAVGDHFALGPHRVTRDEIVEFARAFDPQPFHLDEAAGDVSVLHGLSASGWHTSALLTRLMCDAVLTESAVLGSSGMDEVKWLKPVHADDVLAGEMRVTGVRASQSRPGVGIMTFVASLSAQDVLERIVMSGMFFIRRRA